MILFMQKEEKKSLLVAIVITLLMGAAILIGSRNLKHFDAALVGYTFATLWAAFAITYRYSMWLQRPPTQMYWRRGWQLMFAPKHFVSNAKFILYRVVTIIGGNSFIWKRSKERGLAHWLIMWGCILAAAITFPLVFGWLYFIVPDGDLTSYKIVMFGFPTFGFQIETSLGHLIFHGLVVSSFLVTAGVMLAFRRRMRDRDAAVLQSFSEDFMPLFLLFAISITGLFLTVSYTWLRGYGYAFLSIFHAVTVIFTLISLPFGKFFHIFMRPAQFGVSIYKKIGQEEMAKCGRCDIEYASVMHVNDLIEVQKSLGYAYEMEGDIDHYQRICPRCRRMLLGLSQGKLWNEKTL